LVPGTTSAPRSTFSDQSVRISAHNITTEKVLQANLSFRSSRISEEIPLFYRSSAMFSARTWTVRTHFIIIFHLSMLIHTLYFFHLLMAFANIVFIPTLVNFISNADSLHIHIG
jgi:hypothetical protein